MHDEPQNPEQAVPEPESMPAPETQVFAETQVFGAPRISDPYGWYAHQEQLEAMHATQRRQMLRRLRVVLAGGLAAFSLITWLLVRTENPLSQWFGFSGPSRVVRQHLDALSRGEARAAYDFFSVKYRHEIPLREYERLVSTHRAMFRTRILGIHTPAQGEGFAVVDMKLAAASGTRYNARFTLICIEGHWWIDQIRWSEAPPPPSFSHT